MPIILVGGVSVTSGHQSKGSNGKLGVGPSTPASRGRKFITFKKDSESSPTPCASQSGTTGLLHTPISRKGKEKASPDKVQVADDENHDNHDKDEVEEDDYPLLKRKGPGRPRKQPPTEGSKKSKNE
ncbi:hypothetical protein PtB15_3B397 [Puccinia triticina]|nr:hypothetical protein PtB15_3B397 [Puccinia triticina]